MRHAHAQGSRAMMEQDGQGGDRQPLALKVEGQTDTAPVSARDMGAERVTRAVLTLEVGEGEMAMAQGPPQAQWGSANAGQPIQRPIVVHDNGYHDFLRSFYIILGIPVAQRNIWQSQTCADLHGW